MIRMPVRAVGSERHDDVGTDPPQVPDDGPRQPRVGSHGRDADRDSRATRLRAHPMPPRRRAAPPRGCSPAPTGRDAEDRRDGWPRYRPPSPRVAVSRKTSTPSDAYFASVPPTPSDSSSGCASTAISRGVYMSDHLTNHAVRRQAGSRRVTTNHCAVSVRVGSGFGASQTRAAVGLRKTLIASNNRLTRTSNICIDPKRSACSVTTAQRPNRCGPMSASISLATASSSHNSGSEVWSVRPAGRRAGRPAARCWPIPGNAAELRRASPCRSTAW